MKILSFVEKKSGIVPFHITTPIYQTVMQVKILPFSKTDYQNNGNEGINTIGDNSCLPKIIADSFGWKAIGILFTDKQGVSNTLGACRIRRKIVLLPHFSYGPTLNTETATEIIKELKNQGYFCEWRLTVKASEFYFTDKVTTLLPLHDDATKQLSMLDSNVRRKIRKCESNGITIKKGQSELLFDFYDIYSRNMHRLGSPALPKSWFAALLNKYSNGEVVIWCASYKNKPVGAAFMLEYKGFYEACWVSTLHDYNKLYTSYGLYWKMIRHAAEHKGRHFSFGRSSMDSGVHKYKQQWGGIDIPLVWNYSHPQGKNIRSFTFLTKLWKLIPYKAANFIGPKIAGRFY